MPQVLPDTMPQVLPERLYQIRNDGAFFCNESVVFCSGRLPDGTQVLVGLQPPELAVVEFEADGSYRATRAEALGGSDPVAYLREWRAGRGFTVGTIQVRRFFLPERWIGIQDLPDHYQAVLDRPGGFEPERLEELREDIRQWREAGDFVLYWDEDYYLDRDGEIVSS